MATTNSTELISKIVLEKAIDKLDLDSALDEALPQIKKAMQKGIVDCMKEYDYYDLVANVMESNAVKDALTRKLTQAMGIA